MAALKADDDIGALRQPVDDLALAFVAPLRSDDDYICHSGNPRSWLRKRQRRIAPANARAKRADYSRCAVAMRPWQQAISLE
jgi:hypothetical protein